MFAAPLPFRLCYQLEPRLRVIFHFSTVENKKQPELSYCFVKRPDSLAYPLAYTMCSYRYVEVGRLR